MDNTSESTAVFVTKKLYKPESDKKSGFLHLKFYRSKFRVDKAVTGYLPLIFSYFLATNALINKNLCIRGQ